MKIKISGMMVTYPSMVIFFGSSLSKEVFDETV